MDGKESIVEILNLYYGSASLLGYSESDDEIRFQLPAPITDRQTALFRSREAILNELAISHRLSMLVGRSKCGVPGHFDFAIKAVETAVRTIEVANEYNVSLRFEVVTKRHDSITALRSTLVTKYGVEARTTVTSFNVLPPSLAHFVRRARHFLDYADVKIGRDKSRISTVDDNHFRYYPSEDDRLSDGRRVDHIPALSLIDIALCVSRRVHPGGVYPNISAEFISYTDPRLAFEIVQKKDHSGMEFLQNGRLVAIVHSRKCPKFCPN